MSSGLVMSENTGLFLRGYELKIKLDMNSLNLYSVCTIEGNTAENLRSLSFLLDAFLSIERAELNGKEVDLVSRRLNRNVEYTFETDENSRGNFILQIRYNGKLPDSRFVSPYFISLLYPFRWYPDFCKNSFFIMNVTAIVPSEYVFVSQGNLLSRMNLSRERSFTYEYKKVNRISGVIFKGYEKIVRDYDEGSFFTMYYSALEPLNATNLAETIMWYFGHFTERLGKFRHNKPVTVICAPGERPFLIEEPSFFVIPEKEVAGDFFNWKGFNDFFYEAGCRIAGYWWRARHDTWIQKGLSRYSGMIASIRYFGPDEEKRLVSLLQDKALSINYSKFSDSISGLYSSEAFWKGKFPLVLRLLENYMGIKNYEILYNTLISERQTGLNLESIEKYATEAHGSDLSWFFQQWFEYLSVPELRMEYQTEKLPGTHYNVVIIISQRGKDTFTFPLNIRIITGENRILSRFFIDKREYKFSLSVFQKPVDMIFDEENFILKKEL